MIEGGTEKGCEGHEVARSMRVAQEKRRDRERLVLGSSLQAAVFQTAHQSAAFADVLIQSSCPINSIQPGRKHIFPDIQLESKHNPTGEKQITDAVEMSDISDLMTMMLLKFQKGSALPQSSQLGLRDHLIQ